MDKFYFKCCGVDFYYYYKEDIKLFVEMGFKVYCLFLVWVWIFFKGDEIEFNEVGLKFYDNVFVECYKYGIEFLVIIFYYEMLLNLILMNNGWVSCKIIVDFICYIEVLFKCYKGVVKYWLMFNEINVLIWGFIGIGVIDSDLSLYD